MMQYRLLFGTGAFVFGSVGDFVGRKPFPFPFGPFGGGVPFGCLQPFGYFGGGGIFDLLSFEGGGGGSFAFFDLELFEHGILMLVSMS